MYKLKLKKNQEVTISLRVDHVGCVGENQEVAKMCCELSVGINLIIYVIMLRKMIYMLWK